MATLIATKLRVSPLLVCFEASHGTGIISVLHETCHLEERYTFFNDDTTVILSQSYAQKLGILPSRKKSTMRVKSTVTTKDGITWYYEQEGSGPHIVLIPDGLGECHMFDKAIPTIAAAGFTVTTFDMPGMSRSASAPPDTYTDVTAQKLASYVIGICDHLDIKLATFWGCSSGGSTVLALCLDYPQRVRNVLAHEVPTYRMDYLEKLPATSHDEIGDYFAKLCKSMSGNEEAWDAMGSEVHRRLFDNYVRWAASYPKTIPGSSPTEVSKLRGKPIDWTIGFSTLAGAFMDNVVTATKADIPIRTLPGMHFPYVSHSDVFANYVIERTQQYV